MLFRENKFREICKPYLSHQRKYIHPKLLKNRSTKIYSLQVQVSFNHSLIPKWFLDSTKVSKYFIFLKVKDIEYNTGGNQKMV